MNYFNFWILLIGIFVISCNETLVIEESSLNTNYYPVDTGSVWIYQMDSTIYDDEGLTITSTTSFLKETLIEKTINNSGDTLYILEISKRKDNLSEWLVTDLWTLEKSDILLKRTEENLKFVKLVFPPLLGSTWEGNQFDENINVEIAGDNIMMYENWDYLILENLSSFDNGIDNYDEVLEIQQADDENLIERRYSKEYYAKDIGLVKREMIILDIICSTDCDEELPWEEKGDQGFILDQKLIEYKP